MMRLTLPNGHVMEFDDVRDMMYAYGYLVGNGGAASLLSQPNASSAEGVDIPAGGTASPQADPVNRFARSDGQRRLLQVLIAADGPLTDDELASKLDMNKNKVLGTMGAIFARAGEQNVVATEIVRRERLRGEAGRRFYRYSAGPLLRGADEQHGGPG
jgi:hypothetical protein